MATSKTLICKPVVSSTAAKLFLRKVLLLDVAKFKLFLMEFLSVDDSVTVTVTVLARS